MDTLLKEVAVMPKSPWVAEAVVTTVTPLAQSCKAFLNKSGLMLMGIFPNLVAKYLAVFNIKVRG
jgi:hypothetical protein